MSKNDEVNRNNSKAIQGLEPANVYQELVRFSDVTPRISGNEKAAALYIKERARELKLFAQIDEYNNVIVYVPASKGMAQEPPYMLQAHLDMVTIDETGKHDFIRDPIEIIRDGDYLKAKGTTFGGDNAGGVAIMLVLMSAKGLSHPPLELVFTAREEKDYGGAKHFNKKLLSATRMINLDAERGVHEICVGCAGSKELKVTFKPEWVTVADELQTYNLKVISKGGHSGMNIHQRLNSILVLSDIVEMVNKKFTTHLISISGGEAPSAIPAMASLILGVDSAVATDFEEMVNGLHYDVPAGMDDTLSFSLEKLDVLQEQKILSVHDGGRVLKFMGTVFNGPFFLVQSKEGNITASSSLGTLKTIDEEIQFVFMVRGNTEDDITAMLALLKSQARRAGAEAVLIPENDAPCWLPQKNSQLLKQFQTAYQEVYGKEIKTINPHCTLESTFFTGAIVEMDAIATGPELIDVHSVYEKMYIPSLGECLELIVKVLAMKIDK